MGFLRGKGAADRQALVATRPQSSAIIAIGYVPQNTFITVSYGHLGFPQSPGPWAARLS